MRKLLNILKRFFISTVGEDWWNIRNSIERFFFVIEFHALLLTLSILPLVITSFKDILYSQILVLVLFLWLIGRIISYGSIYTSISRDKAWVLVISNIFLDLLFIVALFDIALNVGLLDIIKKFIIDKPKEDNFTWISLATMFSIAAIYLILFIVLTKARHELPKLFPTMKRFWNDSNLGWILLDFILLSLYVILFFAFIYYMLYVTIQFKGFSVEKINLGEFIYYSFNILYSSPISSIEPTSAVTKTVTAIESLFSYLILVVFISLILNHHTQNLLKRNRAKQKSKRKFKSKHRF